MKRQSNLLNATLATVVPQEPLVPVVDGIRFVNSVVVPLVLTGSNDGVCGKTLPVGNSVLRSCDADLCVVHITKSDVEHHVPVSLTDHLAGRNSFFLPIALWVGTENRVVLVLGPFQSVLTGGVTDGIRLVLLTA